jgi:hypothetical protein
MLNGALIVYLIKGVSAVLIVGVVTALGLLALAEGIDRLILALHPQDTDTILIR